MKPDWYHKARGLGWPEQELDSFQNLFESPHRTVTVEQVGSWTLQVCIRTVLDLDGIDVHGVTRTHSIPFERRHTWRRQPIPATLESQPVDPTDWCPAHADRCARSTRACVRSDEQPVILLEIGPYKVSYEPIAALPAPTPEILHAPTIPARKKKKSSILPGQLPLLTGRALPAPEPPTTTKGLPSGSGTSPPDPGDSAR